MCAHAHSLTKALPSSHFSLTPPHYSSLRSPPLTPFTRTPSPYYIHPHTARRYVAHDLRKRGGSTQGKGGYTLVNNTADDVIEVDADVEGSHLSHNGASDSTLHQPLLGDAESVADAPLQSRGRVGSAGAKMA
jgi:hypothetical protein